MEEIKRLLQCRKEFLEEIREKKKISLADAPKGTMRLNTSNGRTQYFHRRDPDMRGGLYIPQKNILFAQSLAQKDYDQKVLQSIEQEIKAIEKYLSSLPKLGAEEIFETLHQERQKLVTPIRETDEQYIKRWVETPFQSKEIDDTVPPLFTEKGERVRSKSEMIIADILHRENIPYRYECPIWLKGLGKVHPDFTALNIKKRKEIYWEHLGMMDSPEYAETALNRIATYEKNEIVLGDNLIITWETKKSPLNQNSIRRIIKRYFE